MNLRELFKKSPSHRSSGFQLPIEQRILMERHAQGRYLTELVNILFQQLHPLGPEDRLSPIEAFNYHSFINNLLVQLALQGGHDISSAEEIIFRQTTSSKLIITSFGSEGDKTMHIEPKNPDFLDLTSSVQLFKVENKLPKIIGYSADPLKDGTKYIRSFGIQTILDPNLNREISAVNTDISISRRLPF